MLDSDEEVMLTELLDENGWYLDEYGIYWMHPDFDKEKYSFEEAIEIVKGI